MKRPAGGTTAGAASGPVVPAGLRARFRTGIAWSLVATAASQGSTFASGVIVANLLGRQVFGEYAMVRSTLLALAALAPLATGYTATKYVAEFRSTDRERAGRVLGLCQVVSASAAVLIALVLLAVAPWLAEILGAPHLTPALAIASVPVVFTAIGYYQTGALAGLERYGPLARASGVGGAASLTACALGAWTAGLIGALAGLGVAAAVQWLVLRRALAMEAARQMIAPRFRGLRSELPILSGFAVPAALSGMVSMSALWLASAVLARQTGGYEQMALYAAAASLRGLVLVVPNIVHTVGMSLLNYERGLREEARFRKVFWVSAAVTAAAVVIAAVPVGLAGRWLMRMFGESFDEGFRVLLILLASAVAEALALSAYQVLQSHAKLWLSLLAVVVPQYGTVVLLAFLLTARHGAVGLALAIAAGWTVNMVVTCLLARHQWRSGNVDGERALVARAEGP
jgi:O-antigen/teichoic acid export membrane protein